MTQYTQTQYIHIQKSLVSFYLFFLKPYKWYILGLTTIVTAIATCFAIIPYMLKIIIDQFMQLENLTDFNPWVFWKPIVAYIVIYELINIGYRTFDILITLMIPRLRSDLRNYFYRYLQLHSYSYLQNHMAGTIGNKLLDIGQSFVRSVELFFYPFFQTILGLLISIGVMAYVHPLSALVLTSWAAIFLTISFFTTPNANELARLFSESRSRYMGKVMDSISHIVTIKLFSRRDYEYDYIQRYQDEFVKANRTMNWYVTKVRWLLGMSITIFVGFLLYFLVEAYSHKLISIGDIAFILTMSISVINSLFFLASTMLDFFQTIGTCRQARSLIATPHQIIDHPKAKELDVKKGKIEFKHVSFHYDAEHHLFTDHNVTIKSGQKVGLVGYSGSGKTTFVNLILRFFDVEQGEILLDGQDIKMVTQDSLRSSISMIPQDTSLFHRSLMENVRYGRLDATDEEIIAACKRAHCHEFITDLPEGYRAKVGERGIKLSGGQRQRIAIARAILKDAPIIILDEATSALDSMTEKKIQDSLKELMETRTSIVIAHRLSTLADMDRILVFDKGRIVEDGTHEELMKAKGHYSEMWKMQAGGFLPDSGGV